MRQSQNFRSRQLFPRRLKEFLKGIERNPSVATERFNHWDRTAVAPALHRGLAHFHRLSNLLGRKLRLSCSQGTSSGERESWRARERFEIHFERFTVAQRQTQRNGGSSEQLTVDRNPACADFIKSSQNAENTDEKRDLECFWENRRRALAFASYGRYTLLGNERFLHSKRSIQSATRL